jgi:outer membrane protein OmpA-like peptidoglycan-associated protein
VEINTRLQEIKAGVNQVLGGVYFEFKSATLFPESTIVLDKWVTFLKDHPKITMEISGYTDDAGTEQENKLLSTRRAQTVRTYLLSKGIDGRRLVFSGYGETQPVTSNASAINGRDVNRRVEIKILTP